MQRDALSWLKWEQSFADIFRWLRTGARAPFPTLEEIEASLPVLKPNMESLQNFHADEDLKHGVQTTWIGHSTFLVQMEGCNILTDPVFYDRCSPIPFLGPKRYRPPALTLEELPRIDAVVGETLGPSYRL